MKNISLRKRKNKTYLNSFKENFIIVEYYRIRVEDR